jgi:uncharacterized metal-binding protein YceD (DUF177 family)
MHTPPLSIIYDLSNLSDAGAELTIAATPEQRDRLAEWAEVQSIDKFEAQVTLKRRSPTRFEYQADLTADIVQSCVVTLEPVPAHLALQIARSLHLTRFPRGSDIGSHELAPASDEGSEELEDAHYDIAAPLQEEFSLAVEAYPRAPGVVFEASLEGNQPESPFAVLKSLKGKS